MFDTNLSKYITQWLAFYLFWSNSDWCFTLHQFNGYINGIQCMYLTFNTELNIPLHTCGIYLWKPTFTSQLVCSALYISKSAVSKEK